MSYISQRYSVLVIGMIDQIKMFRCITDYGLKESKMAVEFFIEMMGLESSAEHSSYYFYTRESVIKFAQFSGLFARGLLEVTDDGIFPVAPTKLSPQDVLEMIK